MKQPLAPALAAAIATTAVGTALAADLAPLSSRTITIVVPTAAGGGNDAVARTIAQKLGLELGQTMMIDNRAGANGSTASNLVPAPYPTATA